jgi:hypothetical protein
MNAAAAKSLSYVNANSLSCKFWWRVPFESIIASYGSKSKSSDDRSDHKVQQISILLALLVAELL